MQFEPRTVFPLESFNWPAVYPDGNSSKSQPGSPKASSKFVSPRFTVGSCAWAIPGVAVAAAHKPVRRKSDTSLAPLRFVVLSECIGWLDNPGFQKA